MGVNILKEMVYQPTRKIEVLCEGFCEGYQFYILNLGTHPTAYIEIPSNHEFYKKDYNDIDDIIDVHGGFTYAEDHLQDIKSDSWFLGWDYAHFGDYCGYYKTFPMISQVGSKKWTTQEILRDVENVIKQIKEVSNEQLDRNREIN